jgi:uncharacterized protein YfiM (DUF2279 family)
MSDITERRAAQTIGELDVHLGYVQRELQALAAAVAQMATKQDIQELDRRMAAFATKDELAAVERRLTAQSIGSSWDRLVKFVTQVGTLAGVLAGTAAAFAALVHFLDRVPK